jgi:hypothetical protein
MIEKASLRNAEAYFSDRVSLSSAAILLGLARGRVEELVAAGFLSRVSDVKKSRGPWLLSRRDIEAFLRRLSRSSREPEEEERTLGAATILKTHLGIDGEFISLIRAIDDGILQPINLHSSRNGLSGLSLAREDFFAWRSMARQPLCAVRHTVTEAAKRLGVKQEVAYDLVQTGLLGSDIGVLGKRKCQLIRDSDIERFQTLYVAAADLAVVHKTSPKALVQLLLRKGSLPAVGPHHDNCRQYFFRRKDIPNGI